MSRCILFLFSLIAIASVSDCLGSENEKISKSESNREPTCGGGSDTAVDHDDSDAGFCTDPGPGPSKTEIKYKLTYFNFNALAEPIRWLFKVAQVPFEDERIEEENWGTLKNSGRFPGKQMPLLEIDGTVFTQSNAILRYLGNKFGFVGDSDLSNFRLDQVVDIVTDGRIAFLRTILETDADKTAEMKEDLLSNTIPTVLTQLNNIVYLTAPDGDFILGSKLTWADLVLANWLSIWKDQLDASILKEYPVLEGQREAVLDLAQIKAWLGSRPKVPF